MVSYEKVYDYLRNGLLSVKLSNGMRRVMPASLIAWLKELETRGVVCVAQTLTAHKRASRTVTLINYRQQTPLWTTPIETPDTPSYAVLVTA